MKRRASVLVVAVAATAMWLAGPSPSQADYSDWCNDGSSDEIEVPLLSTPIKLGVSVNPTTGLTQLCYSTAPTPVVGYLAGGVVQATPQVPSSGAGTVLYIGCGKDGPASFGASCNTNTGAVVDPSYQWGVGQTYRVTLSYTLCHVSGCTAGSQPVADWTGVIVGTFGVLGSPGDTDTGASVYVDSFYACANGTCQRIDGIIGAGTNADAFRAATADKQFCVLTICQVLPDPTSESVAYNGQSLLTLHILGTHVPVFLPGGAQCIQKFGSTNNPPC